MASTIWKGYITFGLISVPVRLFAAARSERVSFNQIHEVCNSRIKNHLYCPTCEREVERSELKRGYQIEKNRYVLIEDDEIKKVAPRSTESMEILEFVKLKEIDPLYYDASYYAVPEDPGRKAYHLLFETMRKTGYAALAKIAMHQRENIVVIRPMETGLALHTMYYPNEVRAVPEFGNIAPAALKQQEVTLAEQLIQSLAGPFQPEKYEDEYQKRLTELIEAKGQGEEVSATPKQRSAPVIDLMAALQKSLAAAGKSEPAKKPAAKATAKKQHAKVRKAS